MAHIPDTIRKESWFNISSKDKHNSDCSTASWQQHSSFSMNSFIEEENRIRQLSDRLGTFAVFAFASLVTAPTCALGSFVAATALLPPLQIH